MVEAKLERSDGTLSVVFGDHRLTVADQLLRSHADLAEYVGRSVVLGVRPEDMQDASLDSDAPADRRLVAACDYTEPLGAEVLVYFTVVATGVDSGATTDPASTEAGSERTRLVARVDPRTRIAEGSRMELAVDTSRLYFFDPETRAAL
jgi:multiple sugar transport system ATP-binding protein